MPLSDEVAAVLDEAFIKSGMSQRALGEAAGISQSQVSKYLRGVRVLDVNRLDAACTALGLDLIHVIAHAKNAHREDRP